MENLKYSKEVLSLRTAQEFILECHNALHKIEGLAPSDGSVSMYTDYDGSNFRTKLKIASSELQFSLTKAAHSPFVALESVLREATRQLHLWSVTRIQI